MYATDWMSSVIAKAAKFVVLAGEGGRGNCRIGHGDALMSQKSVKQYTVHLR